MIGREASVDGTTNAFVAVAKQLSAKQIERFIRFIRNMLWDEGYQCVLCPRFEDKIEMTKNCRLPLIAKVGI